MRENQTNVFCHECHPDPTDQDSPASTCVIHVCVFRRTDGAESGRPGMSFCVISSTRPQLSEPQFPPCYKEANPSSVRSNCTRILQHPACSGTQQTAVPFLLPGDRGVSKRRRRGGNGVPCRVFFVFILETLPKDVVVHVAAERLERRRTRRCVR